MSDQSVSAESEQSTEQTPQQQIPENLTNQESVTGILSRELTKEYVKFVAGIYAVVGAGIGLGIIVTGLLGLTPFEPELSSVVQGPLESEVANYEAILGQMQTNRVATQAMNVAPIAAAVLGVLAGVYVASNLSGSDRESYITAGASSAAGGVVLTAIVGAIATWQAQPIPQPELTGEAGEAVEQDPLAADVGLGVVEGVPSAVLVGGTELSAVDLALFAVAVGIAAGIAAAGAVYVVRNLTPDEEAATQNVQ